VNRDTFKLLQRMRNPKVATLMLPYLEDEEVAGQVAEAIGRLGSMGVSPTLDSITGYKNDTVDVRVLELHIRILGKLKDVRAAETLEALATHPSERIRDAVDRALFQIRGY
jgi:HEAT repeat protein